MNVVEPIRDAEMVKDICNYLKKNNDRDYIMFVTGIYSGLRISDILNLRNGDARRLKITVREKKTGKQRIIEINPTLKKALTEFTEGKDPDDYLIKSREGYNRPIDRTTAWKILQKVAKKFGLENIGTHTLRKTFGYHFYMQYKDIYLLMAILNHDDPADTKRCIGLEQEAVNKAMKNFKIF